MTQPARGTAGTHWIADLTLHCNDTPGKQT